MLEAVLPTRLLDLSSAVLRMATFIGNKFGEEDHAKLVRCSARWLPTYRRACSPRC